jgi:hypothetical protein
MPVAIISGESGTVWTNTTGKILFQLHVNFVRSCALCIQFANKIGPYWPVPYHSACNCRCIPIKPGQQAMPFIDYQDELRKLGPVAQRNAMGASNWRLVESGLAKWEDVVTKGRVRDFREVADRLDLSVDRMVKAGVRPDLARKAYDATHTEAHAASAKDRAALIKGLKAHGVKDERIAAEVGDLLASRVGVVGPGGGRSGIAPPPAPKPPKPAPARVAAMRPKQSGPSAPSSAPHGEAPVAPPTATPTLDDRRAVAKAEAEKIRARLPGLEAEESRLRSEFRAVQSAHGGSSPEALAAYRPYGKVGDEFRSEKARLARLEKFDELASEVPGLVPALPIGERLAMYGDGHATVAKLAAIRSRIDDHDIGFARTLRSELDAMIAKFGDRDFVPTQADREDYRSKMASVEKWTGIADGIRAREREAAARILATGGDVPLSAEKGAGTSAGVRLGKPNPAESAVVDEGVAYVRSVASGAGSGPVGLKFGRIPASASQRAFYQDGKVAITPDTKAEIVVHEIGHALEEKLTLGGDPAVARSLEFLRYRARGEQPTPIFPEGFGDPAMAKEKGIGDDFGRYFDPTAAKYVGKDYGGSASEVLSMGMEALYRDPAGFARADPEYAAFVVGILKGDLR